MKESWEEVLSVLRYAFQPIVLSTTGQAYGFEALLRGWEEAGFRSVESVFDSAFLDNTLLELDRRLRLKAMADFAAWAPAGTKLFYNLDNRIFASSSPLLYEEEGSGIGIPPARMVLEISERHELDGSLGLERSLSRCRARGYRIAIDDFGSGYAGLKLLRASEPDIVKIDRHFVEGAEPRKAAFLEKIVGMAHLMGVPVIAEGVETEAELSICLEAGCDMLQGYLAARPRTGQEAFESTFAIVARSKAEARRGRSRGIAIPGSSMRPVEPVQASGGLLRVLSRFRKEIGLDILPVIDSCYEPVGVYLERDFRQYVYSPFGISLLEHLESGMGSLAFLRKAPIVAAEAGLARALEVFNANPGSGGVILTRDNRYAGLLPATELLSLLAERELSEARDQNPLTRLPGNLRIAETIAAAMSEPSRGRAFAYFDFDDFKPFNDRYGFRLGDRVIQLFADILRTVYSRPSSFVGHVGGDDFFSLALASTLEEALASASEAAGRFRREAASFYPPEDRERGWILGKGRSGRERKMPLLGASAAVVFAPEGTTLDGEALSDLFAELKKEAKVSESRVAFRVLGESDAAASPADPCPVAMAH